MKSKRLPDYTREQKKALWEKIEKCSRGGLNEKLSAVDKAIQNFKWFPKWYSVIKPLGKEILYDCILLFMRSGTFSCRDCKVIFQLIGISTTKNPRYCAYCGGEAIQSHNVILA